MQLNPVKGLALLLLVPNLVLPSFRKPYGCDVRNRSHYNPGRSILSLLSPSYQSEFFALLIRNVDFPKQTSISRVAITGHFTSQSEQPQRGEYLKLIAMEGNIPDSLLALIPVALMVLFLLIYFCRYANTLEKCFNSKLLNCLGRRTESRSYRTQTDNRSSRRESVFPNQQLNSVTDQDEALILLKGQITRMVLAESEAMRLAKTLFENNEFAARECIANLRSNLFPNLSVNSAFEDHGLDIENPHPSNNEAIIAQHLQKVLERPPSYEDCV